MIVINIPELPNIAKLLSDRLNLLSHHCTVSNLFLRENESPDISLWDGERMFLELLSIVDQHFEYEISSPPIAHFGRDHAQEIYQSDHNYRFIAQVLEALSPSLENFSEKPITLVGIYLGFQYHWMGIAHLRSAYHINKKTNTGRRGLNLTIADLCNNYFASRDLKSYLQKTFDLYYNGYIIGNDFFRNIFIGNLRAYTILGKTKPEYLEVEELLKVIFDVSLLDRTEHQDLVTQAYKALVSYCEEKFDECLLARDETEVILAHGRLTGLLKLIISMFRDFEHLRKNPLFEFQYNFFVEISCDCGAMNSHRFSDFESPKFVHWLLTLFLHNSIQNEDFDLDNCSKERLFLSARVREYINSVELNKESVREHLNIIDFVFREYDYRFIKPIYLLRKADFRFLRREYFNKIDFKSSFSIYGTFTDFIYDIYTEKAKDINLLTNDTIQKAIALTHIDLCINEIEKLLIANSEASDYQQKLNAVLKMQFDYPANQTVFQELAIILDEGGYHQEAVKVIQEALQLDFNNPLLWQSYAVISKNLGLLIESNIANYLLLNNSEE